MNEDRPMGALRTKMNRQLPDDILRLLDGADAEYERRRGQKPMDVDSTAAKLWGGAILLAALCAAMVVWS